MDELGPGRVGEGNGKGQALWAEVAAGAKAAALSSWGCLHARPGLRHLLGGCRGAEKGARPRQPLWPALPVPKAWHLPAFSCSLTRPPCPTSGEKARCALRVPTPPFVTHPSKAPGSGSGNRNTSPQRQGRCATPKTRSANTIQRLPEHVSLQGADTFQRFTFFLQAQGAMDGKLGLGLSSVASWWGTLQCISSLFLCLSFHLHTMRIQTTLELKGARFGETPVQDQAQ